MGLSSRAEKPWQPESSTDLLHKAEQKGGVNECNWTGSGLIIEINKEGGLMVHS